MSVKPRMSRMASWTVVLSLLIGSVIFGQGKTTGAISGTVFDPTGAVVAGAKVQLRDQLTGALRETVTNEVGAFLFPNLPFGTYEVTVTMPGFQTAVLSRVVVESARTTDVVVHLKIGEVVETVQIEGATRLWRSPRTRSPTRFGTRRFRSCRSVDATS